MARISGQSSTTSQINASVVKSDCDQFLNTVEHNVVFSVHIDATVFRSRTTSSGTGIVLPAKSRIVGISFVENANGAGTIDMGTSADADAIADGVSIVNSSNFTPAAGWESAFAGDEPTELVMRISAAASTLRGAITLQYTVNL